MSSNFANQTPYLRTSREFPENLQALSVEITKSYIDIANCVNNRTISIFNKGRPVINGESWFLTSNRQQAIRQVYTFTAAGNIAHGINWGSVSFISPLSYGSYTDGTNYYGVTFNTQTPAASQVVFYVTSTNIVVVRDGAAPAISSGIIVLEWITNT